MERKWSPNTSLSIELSPSARVCFHLRETDWGKISRIACFSAEKQSQATRLANSFKFHVIFSTQSDLWFLLKTHERKGTCIGKQIYDLSVPLSLSFPVCYSCCSRRREATDLLICVSLTLPMHSNQYYAEKGHKTKHSKVINLQMIINFDWCISLFCQRFCVVCSFRKNCTRCTCWTQNHQGQVTSCYVFPFHSMHTSMLFHAVWPTIDEMEMESAQ